MSILEIAGVSSTKEGSIYDLLFHYFQLNPTPTDAQIHALAVSVGQDPEAFEQLVFKMLGAIVDELDVEADAEDEDFIEEAVENTELDEDDEKKSLYFDGVPDEGENIFDRIVQDDGYIENTEDAPGERPLAADDGSTI